MRRAGGIALISVLLIMFGILIIGIGTLLLTNSGLMISQNLVSHSVARTNAESGVDATVAVLMGAVEAGGDLPATLDLPQVNLEGGALEFSLVHQPEWIDDVAVIRVEGRGPRNARHVSEAVVAYEPGTAGSTITPFKGVIEACQSVLLSGGSRIDSYDSRLGNYNSNNANRNAHVNLLGPNGDVTIQGYSPIWGDVYSTGGITAKGSSNVLGNMHANGTIRIEASNTYDGSITTTSNLILSNTATVTGSVHADGNIDFTNGAKVHGNGTSGGNIRFTNSGAQIQGDALARGSITYSGGASSLSHHVHGVATPNGHPLPNPPVPVQSCDPLDLPAATAGLTSLPTDRVTLQASRPQRNMTLTPGGVFRAGPDRWDNAQLASEFTAHSANVFGTTSTVYRIDAVNVGSDSNLRVSGGHVVLFVDGDVRFDGGSNLNIEPDSSLTIIARGKTTFTGGFTLADLNPVNDSGMPQLALYSLHGQGQSGSWLPTGVELSGHGQIGATIYAPFSKVNMSGSGGVFGSLLGGAVELSGSGALHYDEALGDVELGVIDGGESEPASIRLVSRR